MMNSTVIRANAQVAMIDFQRREDQGMTPESHGGTARRFAWACIGLLAFLGATSIEEATAGVNAWTSAGPRTEWSLLAADPRQGGATFLGSRGRFFRSTDDGAHWSQVTVAGLPAPEPQAFSFDSNVAHRVYAALGSYSVFRSDNDGADWVRLSGAFGSSPIPSVVGPVVVRLQVAVSDSNHIYVLDTNTLSQPSLKYSADGGTSWNPISPPVAELGFTADFTLDQSVPNALYATGTGGVVQSLDNGATWRLINAGLPAGLTGASLAVDPTKPGRVFMLGWTGRVGVTTPVLYVSNNQGAQWTPTGAVFSRKNAFSAQIVFDTTHPGILYVRSGTEIVRSIDDAATWQIFPLLHGASSLGLAVLASGKLATTTANYGFLRSDDQGATWLALNQALPLGRTLRLGAVAGNDFVLFGLVDIPPQVRSPFAPTTFRRGSTANLWLAALSDVPGQGFITFGTSARDSGRVLGATTSATGQLPDFLSNDAGATWQPLNRTPPTPFGRTDSFIFSPASDATVYAIGVLALLPFGDYSPGALFRSTDGGVSWQDVRPPNILQTFASLAIDPSQPAVVYVGSGTGTGVQLLRSADAGDHWTILPLPQIQGNTVASILINPNNTQQLVIAAGASTGIYQSNDSGQTWTPIGDHLTGPTIVRALAADWSATPQLLFAGTDQGVFTSPLVPADGAWSRMAGTENLSVNDLRLDRPRASTDRLTVTAATDSGVWEYTFDPAGILEPVFRFYNTQTGAHFYTASATERDHVLATWPQFLYEGAAFFAAAADPGGALPIYRFFNTQTGAHFYTASAAERDKVIATLPQFVFEGISFYGFDDSEPGSVKLYRFYNTQTGAHFYTTQDDERDAVDQHLPQFVDEGVVYNVYPAASQQ
jgi:photosystem II stability/assembly factor-like uncharacterized protein